MCQLWQIPSAPNRTQDIFTLHDVIRGRPRTHLRAPHTLELPISFAKHGRRQQSCHRASRSIRAFLPTSLRSRGVRRAIHERVSRCRKPNLTRRRVPLPQTGFVTLTNKEPFMKYPPAVAQMLKAHGGGYVGVKPGVKDDAVGSEDARDVDLAPVLELPSRAAFRV